MGFGRKVKDWLRRYLLAEIVSTTLSLATAWLIMESTGDRVMSAFVGSAVASISFYGVVAIKDISTSLKHHKNNNEKYRIKSFLIDFRNLIIEFGPAEILDVIAVRPFFMYLIPKLTGEFILSTLAGKIIADIFFFVLAIVMYELRKKHLPKHSPGDYS